MINIIELGVGDLQEYGNNPRNNDSAVDAVAESIKQFGFKVPIVVDKNNVIAAGHTRLKAAKKLGLDKVPCIIADDLTDEQIKAFRLADNKVGELATWDFEKLDFELNNLDLDMQLFGFEYDDGSDDVKEKAEKDLSDKVKETFEVIIECSDEAQQEEVYNKLTNEGYTCRVLTL